MSNDVTTRDPEVMLGLDVEEAAAGVPATIERPEPQRPRVVSSPVQPQRGGQLAVERVIVRHSEDVNELFGALAEAQMEPEYGDVTKTQTARIASRKEGGANYAYSYETLQDVIAATRPHLAKVGLAVMQFPFPGERSVTIRTFIAHKSGQWLYNDLAAQIPMPDPQAIGSAISYLRRYAMKSILNVAATDEDDDAEYASRPAAQPQSAPRPAQRKSSAPAPEKAKTPEPAKETRPKADGPAAVGTIQDLVEKSGGVLITLSTGFRAATRNPELIAALKDLRTGGKTIELTTHASPDPAKYAPVLDEITIQAAE